MVKPSGTIGQRLANGGVACGAKRRRGGKCTLAAGWGTNHLGIGKCRFHGGTSPNHVKAAATAEYRALLGTPIEVNPYEALLTCIKISAGEIEWLSQKLGELQEKDWVEDTIAGKQFHLYARERKARMQDLARYSQMAISLGIDAARVNLAQTYAERIAWLIQGILGDLDLSEEQRAGVPSVVHKWLLALDGQYEQKALEQKAGVAA